MQHLTDGFHLFQWKQGKQNNSISKNDTRYQIAVSMNCFALIILTWRSDNAALREFLQFKRVLNRCDL